MSIMRACEILRTSARWDKERQIAEVDGYGGAGAKTIPRTILEFGAGAAKQTHASAAISADLSAPGARTIHKEHEN